MLLSLMSTPSVSYDVFSVLQLPLIIWKSFGIVNREYKSSQICNFLQKSLPIIVKML